VCSLTETLYPHGTFGLATIAHDGAEFDVKLYRMPDKQYTATSERAWLPRLGFFGHFQKRETMKVGRPTRNFNLSGDYPHVSLPIDWTMNNTLAYPMDGNDQYSDCLYAAACHGDNTFTGNNGSESSFNVNTIIQDYLRLSGGDNGLNEGQIVSEWRRGLANTSDATILAVQNVDPNDKSAMQAAIYFFGGVVFSLALPDKWKDSVPPEGGVIWDAPAVPDPKNGHAVWFDAVDVNGYYRLQTWGSYAWITPAGVAECDPGCFVVFSRRWFNTAGVAPNGLTFSRLAALWIQFGGEPVTRWKLLPMNLSGGVTIGPAAVGNPSVFVTGLQDQAHILYVAGNGQIWDSYFSGGGWHLQAINLQGGVTPMAPAAESAPACFAFNRGTEQHFLYRDGTGRIWDSYFGPHGWKLQAINLSGGVTAGPPTVGDPSSFLFGYGDQVHILYRDAAGRIWDSYFGLRGWQLQQINLPGGVTSKAPAAAGDSACFVFDRGRQAHVLYRDMTGQIWDSYFGTAGWKLQPINLLGGVTPKAPAAVSDPFCFVFDNQAHILYRDSYGQIWDSYFGRAGWQLQTINMAGGLTPKANAAVGKLSFFEFDNQAHILYRDANGVVWDSYFSAIGWQSQMINVGGVIPDAPPAAGDPTSFIFNNGRYAHVIYPDSFGRIWDVYYG
jgi:hypothetical protein